MARSHSLILSLALAATCLAAADFAVPIYSHHGTPYANGFYVGTQAQHRIRKFLEVDDFYKSTLKPFWNSNTVVVSWFNAVIWRTEFNDYVEELWGIADAMNMSRLDVFALNCADDIDLYTRSPQGSWFARRLPHAPTRASLKQCSDAVLPSALLWGHNEDAGMDIDMPDASTAYIVNLTNSNTGVRYTAYTYPGQLSGNAWGWNSLGVISTTNAQFPKVVNVDGAIPRNIINRRVLDAANVTQALEWSQDADIASGFSNNLGSWPPSIFCNVESSSEASSKACSSSYFVHFNNYIRLASNVSQWVDDSSTHRLSRANAMGVPTGYDGLVAVLGDTQDADFPIFRNNTGKDTGVVTVSTTVFDLNDGSVKVFEGRNPKMHADAPTLVLQL